MNNEIRMLVGIQGSGKSTYGKEFIKNNSEFVLLSSDEYRELYPSFDNSKIFKMLYGDMNYFLKQGRSIVFDATNTTLKMRKKFFEAIKEPVKYITCIIFNTPYKVCVSRNNNRKNPVPIDVLRRYYENFQIPFIEEGFEDIMLQYPHEHDVNAITDVVTKMDFNQQNKYHRLTCKNHCFETSKNLELKTNNPELITASCIHDYGKAFTKEIDENGEAHYKNHANVGAYELLSKTNLFLEEDKHALAVCFYVNYHMYPYDWNSQKTHEKYKKLFKKNKYNNLILLNEADKKSH